MASDPLNSHSLNSSVGNIEPRNPHFVGREMELTRLQNILAQETFCLLAGAHGVGTTALAVEYAHRFADKYDGGRWQVHCKSGKTNLPAILAVLRLHRASISETQKCLLVLDNVAQPELLKLARELFEKGLDWLHVIVITRLKKEKVFGDEQIQSFLKIEGLPRGDVLALIESFQPNHSFASVDDHRIAERLASLLDGLTLPAALAAASVNYFGSSPSLQDLTGPLFEVAANLRDLESPDPQSKRVRTIRQDQSLTAVMRVILTYLSRPAKLALMYAASSSEQFELSEIDKSLIDDFFKLQLWQSTNELDAKGELKTARMHPLLGRSLRDIYISEIERDRDPPPPNPSPRRKPVDIAPHPLDDNVMFTVYRRKTIAPNKWYPLLAFAHLAERRPDAPPDEPDPVVEVKRQAEALLGATIADYKESSEDSSQSIPRSGELMFKPSVPGIEFNPPSRTLRWEEPVHREEFKMRAPKELDGQVARGCLRVFLGPIIVAEVNLAFKVDSNAAISDVALDLKDHARPFRKVFASYSHKDKAIVEHIEKLVGASHLGLEYLRDVTKLRSGDVWDPSLLRMIDTADLFQLFWSTNAMRSDYVKREYEYALARQLPDFVRPVYWEKPFPERPEEGLPPEALRRLHFEELSFPKGIKVPVPTRSATKKRDRKELVRKARRVGTDTDWKAVRKTDREEGARLAKKRMDGFDKSIQYRRSDQRASPYKNPQFSRNPMSGGDFPLFAAVNALVMVVSLIATLLFLLLKYFGAVPSGIPLLLSSVTFLVSFIVFVIQLRNY